jgi:hypothetical protein
VWALPLDAGLDAYPLAWVQLPLAMTPGSPWTVALRAPDDSAVIVARVAGSLGSAASRVPAATLAVRDPDGRLTLASLTVASPRDDLLLGRPAAPAPITLRSLVEPGSLEARIAAVEAPDVSLALQAAEGTPGRPSLLVRSLAVETAREATPMRSLLRFQDAWPGAARVALSGLPTGVRLVMAGLVPPDGGSVDPATLAVTWIAAARASATGAAPY